VAVALALAKVKGNAVSQAADERCRGNNSTARPSLWPRRRRSQGG